MIETAMVIDDEPLARIGLRKAIERFTDWRVVLELETGEGIEDHVRRLRPDVVFLDIKMPRRNGLSAAGGLMRLDNPPLIVFVSAYSEYALEAFELYALDYLLKPFSDERFKQTVTRLDGVYGSASVRRAIADQQAGLDGGRKPLQVLIVRSVGLIRIVDLDDVDLILGGGNYVEVVLDTETILHRVSINVLQESLNPEHFVRCHRSAIVRIAAIREIRSRDDGKLEIGLRNGRTVRLSQTYKDQVLQAIEHS